MEKPGNKNEQQLKLSFAAGFLSHIKINQNPDKLLTFDKICDPFCIKFLWPPRPIRTSMTSCHNITSP